jgi:hypothetical protein
LSKTRYGPNSLTKVLSERQRQYSRQSSVHRERMTSVIQLVGMVYGCALIVFRSYQAVGLTAWVHPGYSSHM